MKLFNCDNCRQTLYFENSRCVSCDSAVAYSPETSELKVLREPAQLCRNGREHQACNWLVPQGSGAEYCASCALSEIIPDLNDAANNQAWRRIEAAKRRLVYTLLALKLPFDGVKFHFLKGTVEEPVMTGHDEGVITLNIDEADFAFRENMREKMGEGYRTVLGHLRHEIGHFHWDRLVRDSSALEPFRATFGDDRASYEEAIARHYADGAPADWPQNFVSAYASMHPWEDWAETWAHYLHMTDTLETAKSHGLAVRAPAAPRAGERIATERVAFEDFESLSLGWNALSLAMNSLNRSMGMKDAYPFVLSPKVLAKLEFVHDLVRKGDRSISGVDGAAGESAAA